MVGTFCAMVETFCDPCFFPYVSNCLVARCVAHGDFHAATGAGVRSISSGHIAQCALQGQTEVRQTDQRTQRPTGHRDQVR